MTEPDSLFYNDKFYSEYISGSLRSAETVLGMLFDLYKPSSIIDIGCGRGAWLAVAESLGSKTLKGIDGRWVDEGSLLSKSIDFSPVDLEGDIEIQVRYDLAISVEVAEHLPESRAASFVSTLRKASDVVLFSAAIKGQGGTNHINEQWQSYWIDLFKVYDYEVFDIFRGNTWKSNEVEWWYRQNIFLFVNANCPPATIDLDRLRRMERRIYDVVHPENFTTVVEEKRQLTQDIHQLTQWPDLRFCVNIIKRYALNKLGFHKSNAA